MKADFFSIGHYIQASPNYWVLIWTGLKYFYCWTGYEEPPNKSSNKFKFDAAGCLFSTAVGGLVIETEGWPKSNRSIRLSEATGVDVTYV